MSADAPAAKLRDRPWLTQWGINLAYFGAIAALYYNGRAAYETWQWMLQAALLPFVVAAVVLRVRFPYALPILGVIAMATETFSVFIVGMLCLAVRRRGPRVWTLAGLGALTMILWLLPSVLPSEEPVQAILLSVVPAAVIVALVPMWVGGLIRTRRQLRVSAAEQAARAEFERELAARQAAHDERERIAREMHDSLGHVLALVSMQAGAIEVRSTDPEIVSAAEGIRETARSGLTELRAVVRALGEDARLDPAPGLSAVPRLVEASRDAGAVVTLNDDLTGAAALPSSTGRVVYQVVQEALTNAHRHAPGVPVDVALSDAPDAGIEVSVTNRLAPGGDRGAGTGLEALRSRIEMLGGRLDARASNGRFELRAHLPADATT